MPFPFVLPTTSAFSFSSCFTCDTHPSLPLHASTHRGVVRDALKKHKRLPPSTQASNLVTVVSSLDGYIPYLLVVDAALAHRSLPGGETVNAVLTTAPAIQWRPTLSGDVVPGRQRARTKITSFEDEVAFVLSTLATCDSLAARAALQPLYTTTGDFIGAQERTTAITTATKSLLHAASVYEYLANRGGKASGDAACVDITRATTRALGALAHAEATLLAVLKDDPYPAAVAQDRNQNDTDWMFKSPDIPKVRAHLYARLCLGASEHAAKAAALCQSATPGAHKVNPALQRYLDDLRRTSRAKACRFFGIDAELGGQTAQGIGWVRAGMQELGMEPKDAKKGSALGRFKKEFSERREDRRVDKDAAWGADAGKLEEARILEMLDAKWSKINDTMNTQAIPPANSLLAKMPTGREIHTIAAYKPPTLGRDVLEAMRVPPAENDDFGNDLSSDEEGRGPSVPVGAFPGTSTEYGGGTSTGGNAYY